ncbi:hypothetical protein DWG18_07560 [Lysobacter sp. TY2-98]|uniref:hypothetical protein n=1 Tax=Lysobacter sp. TY2-98 TaxID=2290922 RepID=UPI000E203AE6|nr:hypothetical protein [Lysobacter sp. TY2-98]AXK72152.1 hypothetical protein DWG18_07560 [Lysobacter sp. TY2-98]
MSAVAQRLPSSEPGWLSDATLDVVRPHVRRLLQSSPGFRALPPNEQQEIARNMVRVASYMANPDDLARQELGPRGGVLAREAPSATAMPVSRAQGVTTRALDAVENAKNKASDKIGTAAGADFVDASTSKLGANAKKLMEAVDFPKFVGGLIQNVFQAIVDATIQQMRAYAELLKSVSQSVDEFAQDNISMDNARDYVAGKFPDAMRVQKNPDGGGNMLAMNDVEDMDATMARINAELGLAQPVDDISDAEQEARFVQAARLQMARSRQQLLSSMVILGINRIVVTDGQINAKVVFDFRASDEMMRDAQAGLTDTQSSYNRNKSAAGVHFGWGAAGSVNENVQRHMTTVSSSVDETSESKQDMKAKLTGEVRVNFKSDYFPMEKLASPAMIAAIQGNSTPVDPNLPPPRAGANAGTATTPA